MLVLTRLRGEWIDIAVPGLDFLISVEVTDIRGEKIRIGVDAPTFVRIDRREVRLAREQEGKAEPKQACGTKR